MTINREEIAQIVELFFKDESETVKFCHIKLAEEKFLTPVKAKTKCIHGTKIGIPCIWCERRKERQIKDRSIPKCDCGN